MCTLNFYSESDIHHLKPEPSIQNKPPYRTSATFHLGNKSKYAEGSVLFWGALLKKKEKKIAERFQCV